MNALLSALSALGPVVDYAEWQITAAAICRLSVT
jgi:hypothetical protein